MKHSKSPIAMPTQDYLNEALIYDQSGGTLTWKTRPLHHFTNAHGMNTFNSQHSGKTVLSEANGRYFVIRIAGKVYLSHRVIWKLMTGVDPISKIDHRDTNKKNNAWKNLRQATQQQNGFNRGLSSTNKTGFKGVSWDKRDSKFYASIRAGGKSTSLGRFNTKEEAAEAYRSAALKAHGEFANI